MFCDHASVAFDCVVSCVLPPLDSLLRIGESPFELDFKKLHKTCTDKKSKIALNGLLFAQESLFPILDRISESEFGMLVDAIVLLLRRDGLKGNAFHCIRTFHIVSLIIDFVNSISPVDPLFTEDFENTKNFQKLLTSALTYFSMMSLPSYKAVFKGFVADSFIQPMIECFTRSAKLSLFDLLFAGPHLLQSHFTKVSLKLASESRLELWKVSTLLEARFGTFVRQLIDRGFSIKPGQKMEDSISFTIDLIRRSKEELTTLLKGFVDDFENECRGKSFTLSFKIQ